MKEYESVIIGGGPAGITAALYLLRAGIQVAWVEKLSPGGQVLLTENIENYPGFPQGVKGFELVDLFTEHLEGFEYDKLRDEALGIKASDGKFEIELSQERISSRSVIISTGADWKKLGVPGEGKFNGKGISYCALCDGNFFKDQEVACIGGGDTALEESLYLTKLVKKVHLIHRRDAFRGSKIYQDKVLNNPKINILYNTVVREFTGDKDLENVKLLNVQTGEESDLNVQGAFVFIGLIPALPTLPQEVETDEQGFIITDTEMSTSIPGLYAAGDIRSKLCRQITTAVGEGATASHNVQVYLEKTG